MHCQLKFYAVLVLLCLVVVTSADEAKKSDATTTATSTTGAPNATTSTAPSSTPKSTSTSTATTTTTTTTTTPKPKVDILKSEVCKKCGCDGKTKVLDCSAKSKDWLTAAEWSALQNGDIKFETVILQHNNYTNIPIFPPYPMKKLDLSHNNISTIALEAFANLTKLVQLDLSYNNITTAVLLPDVFKSKKYSPSAVNPMENMRELNLAYNDLHALNPDVFEHLPDLEKLILSNNPFTILNVNTEVAISGLNKLKHLDLSYIEIDKLPEPLFHQLRALEVLHLAGNLFKAIPEAVLYAKRLKTLCLDENPIADLKDKNIFPELNELEVLKISYMPDINRIESGAFSNLPMLKTLIASDNKKLSYIDVHAFAKKNETSDTYDYIPIKELNLRNNNLTVVNRDWFNSWTNMTSIDLEFNPWDCDCNNKFLIRDLILHINKTTPLLTKNVECATPNDWKSTTVLLIVEEDRSLPCEDNSANGVALACLLVTILIVLPIGIAGFMLYRRGCFGLRARFSRGDDRALYSRATFSDDFHI